MSARESRDRRTAAIDAALEQRIREQIAWEAAREGPPPGFPARPPLAAGRQVDRMIGRERVPEALRVEPLLVRYVETDARPEAS